MGYEFTPEQDQVVEGLGSKMGFVGTFAIVVGVIELIFTMLVVAAIYRDTIPEQWKEKSSQYLEQVREQLPEETRAEAETYSLENIPPDTQLWSVAINTLVGGIFYILLGAWTRSAGESFKKIAKTQGRDVSHLMDGLGSLHSLFTLLYVLLIIVLSVLAISLIAGVYMAFTS